MIPVPHPGARSVGFTLLELLVALAISIVVLTQILVATFALERSFEAADYRMNAQNDQLRALDYLSRDLHMASAVSVQNGGTSVGPHPARRNHERTRPQPRDAAQPVVGQLGSSVECDHGFVLPAGRPVGPRHRGPADRAGQHGRGPGVRANKASS